MRFEAGDVVRVPFPYVETNLKRFRPALIITREPLGPEGMLLWAAMITNAQRKPWPGDVAIDDLEAAGLPIASVVRTAKVATLETSSAERIGRISASEEQEIRALIARHLGIS